MSTLTSVDNRTVDVPPPPTVLIAEDNERHYQSLHSAISSLEVELNVIWARDYEQARLVLGRRHVDLAFIDLVLSETSEPYVNRWEGLRLIDDIFQLGLKDDLSVVVITSFPRPSLVRLAFVTHRVEDLIDKNESGDLVGSVAGIVDRLQHLGSKCSVEFASSSGDWNSLIHDIVEKDIRSLSSRLSASDALAELASLVRRSYINCERVVLKRLTQGRSGSTVYQVDRRISKVGQVAPSIVKLAASQICERELSGWRSVEQFMSGTRSTRLEGVRRGLNFGALRYSLIGGSGGFRAFRDFYADGTTQDVVECIDGLYGETMAFLRHQDNQVNREIDVAAAYTESLGLRIDGVIQGYEFAFASAIADQRVYSNRDLDRDLPNAVRALVQDELSFSSSSTIAPSHGDLHGENILVDKDGAAWLIDFGSAGPGHWARDYVVLEGSVRFRLLALDDVADLYQLERLLAASELSESPDLSGLSTNADLRKAAGAIIRIRQHAAKATGMDPVQAKVEYEYGLLLTSLKYIQAHRLLDKPWRKHQVMIAAGVLLEGFWQYAAARNDGTNDGSYA